MNGLHLAIRSVRQCVAVGCCWLGAAVNTHGDLLWLKETGEPQCGWVLSQTDELILFRSFAAPDAPAVSFTRAQVELVVITIDTERMLSRLTEIPRSVIKMYFGLDGQEALRLESISQKLGLTRERIRQIKDRALLKLRTCSDSGMLKDYLCK